MEKQELNETNCVCECRSKYYKRCNRKQKMLDEIDCKCYASVGSTGIACKTLPTKWIIFIIIIIVCAILILAIDCIVHCTLLCKSTE